MKDSEWLILLLLAVVICTALYLGVTLSLKKAFKFEPAVRDDSNSRILQEQRRRMDDIRDRQEQLMRDQRQRIRDLQRR